MTQDCIAFSAPIIQHDNINAGYVEFPFSAEEIFGKKGQVKVKVLFDDSVSYRGSLVKMKTEKHLLILTQEVRNQLGKKFGEVVDVKVWHDLEARVVEIPEDVQQIFNENIEAFERYAKMSYTHQKEYMRWITDAKKPETRENRKIKMIEMILDGKKGI